MKMLERGGVFNLNYHISNGCRRNHHKLQQKAGMKMFLMRCSDPPLLQDKRLRTSRSCASVCALSLFSHCFRSPPLRLMQVNVKYCSCYAPPTPPSPPSSPISLSKNFHLNEDPASLFCCVETVLGGGGLIAQNPPF